MAKTTAPRKTEEPKTSPWTRLQNFLADVAALLSMIGGAAVVGGGAIYIWIPDLRFFAVYATGFGGALLLLALLASLVKVKAALTGRRGRYTMNLVIMIAVFLAIMTLVNFISFRNPVRWDVTATKQFSLAPQTTKVLSELKEPVRATAFFVPTQANQMAFRQRADDLFYEFNRRSNKMFTYRYVDPEAEPSIARQYGVTQYPVVVFEALDSGKHHQTLLPPVTEQDFASALLIVTGVQQKRVYFLTGHQERDGNDVAEGSQGIGFAIRGIVNDNYRVDPLNLTQVGKVPKDTAVLVIAGPKRDLLSEEVPLLTSWLEAGGRAIFLLDPEAPQSFKDILAKWGIRVGEEYVVDPGSSVTGDPRTPLLHRGQYSDLTTITGPLDATFFPQASPVEIAVEPKKRPPWIQYLPLASTSLVSWVTKEKERNSFDAAKDRPGPALLALAVKAQAPLDKEPTASINSPVTSIVVFGDSDFISNKYFYAYTNSDFLLNATNWLAEDYALISIRAKPFVFRELVVTRREFDFIRYSSWFILPAAVALVGLVSWWRRR